MITKTANYLSYSFGYYLLDNSAPTTATTLATASTFATLSTAATTKSLITTSNKMYEFIIFNKFLFSQQHNQL